MSQRDNALNATIASASGRDTMDLRATGVVTLSFLLGAFTAVSSHYTSFLPLQKTLLLTLTYFQTLFSTGFFNFGVAYRIVSTWIWLYCVIPVGLTGAAFGAWLLWRSRSGNNIDTGMLNDAAETPNVAEAPNVGETSKVAEDDNTSFSSV